MADQIIWRLRIGTKLSGFTVEPDGKWPGMWRVHSPGGKISDMVNLSRARDAARGFAVRAWRDGKGGLPPGTVIHWERCGSVAEAGPVRPESGEAPG